MNKGAERVGMNFNPLSSNEVDEIKTKAAALINVIDGIKPKADFGVMEPEIERLKNLAMTAAEQASMWAVKAATKE